MYRARKPFYGDQLRIIRSPEKLERDGNPGSDLTNTWRDLELLNAWGMRTGIQSYSARTTFELNVKTVFQPLFDISQPTLLYYTGHRLDKKKASEKCYSASPRLDELIERFVRYRDRYDSDPLFHVLKTLKEKCDGRKVKGGELFLHQFGFCDLYGLLKFWCAAVCDYVNARDRPIWSFRDTWFSEDVKPWLLEDEDPRVPEEEETGVPKDGEPRVPEDEEPRAPEDEEPRVPEDEKPWFLEDKDPRVPEEEETGVPEDEEPRAPEDEEPRVPKDEEPRVPEDEEPRVLEDEEPRAPEDEERRVSEDEELWVSEDEELVSQFEEKCILNRFNSQLLIILDSCYSGEVAQQLHDFVSDIREKVPLPPDGIKITVQAACGTDERTVGGYFTPVFTYLNDPGNEEVLEKWKDEWGKMTEEARRNYKSLDLPSPMVVTTLPAPKDTTMSFSFQNSLGFYTKVTLFPDAGFFKFCYVKVQKHQNKTFEGQDRVLNEDTANDIMNNGQFIVEDYKLKIFRGSSGQAARYAGNPVGLFLVKVPSDIYFCAHIHFAHNNTRYHTRINLVLHHNVPCVETGIYEEDHDGKSPRQIKDGKHKIKVTEHPNANKLVQTCRNFVEEREPGRWSDVNKWNMTGKDEVSVLGKFKMVQERSAWEDKYLKYIEQFYPKSF